MRPPARGLVEGHTLAPWSLALSGPLAQLQTFGAARARVVFATGQEEAAGPGGGLEGALAVHGLRPLTALMHQRPAIRRLELDDGGLGLSLVRDGAALVLRQRWPGGAESEERLAPEPDPLAPPLPDRPLVRPNPASRLPGLAAAVAPLSAPVFAVEEPEGLAWYTACAYGDGPGARPLWAWLPPAVPLGSPEFRARFGVKAAYIAGAMAGGIASAELVIAMGQAGYIGFFGAGGLDAAAVEQGVLRIQQALQGAPCGFNLLHNPEDPAAEEAVVDLYLRHGCRAVSASAFMGLTPAVVRYRYTGIHTDTSGQIVCPNRVLAKLSRPEVAEHFMRPAPRALLDELVGRGALTAEQAALAARWPMADAVTGEADSGGHTDRRPLPVLVPLLTRQRDRIARELGYAERGVRIFIGAGGGIGTPQSVLAAFALGADYVLTGSVNQCTAEAGTSAEVKRLLAEVGMADVAMGPAPDMFELGAQVQVLSRGSLYAQRGKRLYELYRGYASWEEVPAGDRERVEKQILQRPFDEVWAECERYWGQRDPRQLARAHAEPRHRMALVFRWYLGMTSRWARLGQADRKRDYQVWCGPSMGAFNDWVRGSALEAPEARTVVGVADALLEGAARLARVASLRFQGLEVPAELEQWAPGR